MMSNAEKVDLLKKLYGESDDTDGVLSAFLDVAGKIIIARAFPYDNTQSQVPEKYENLQIQIAVYLMSKRGAEGETTHTENGVTRHFGAADIPPTMLSQITPFVGTIS